MQSCITCHRSLGVLEMARRYLIPALLASSLMAGPALGRVTPFLLVADLTPLDEGVVSSAVETATPAPKAHAKMKHKKHKKDRDGAVETEEDHPKTALEIARALGLSDDDVRPDDQLTVNFLGKPLIIGGQLEGDARSRINYDLGKGNQRDQIYLGAQAKLETIWLPSPSLVGFVAARATGDFAAQDPKGSAASQAGVALDEIWLLKTNLFRTPFALQAGRQRFQDKRKFWWDDNLDAVRLHYFGSEVTGFAGVGQTRTNFATLGTIDPEDRRLTRYLGNLSWQWSKNNFFELYGLHQDNRAARFSVGESVRRDRNDDKDAKLTWVGGRARGCIKPGVVRRLCYWGDVVQVRGSELQYDLRRLDANRVTVTRVSPRRVRGSAFDVGASIELPFAFRPWLTLGVAQGSGDPPGTPGVDGAFRQTGLQGNNGKFRGLTRFRYYGEVLRPNLSNIRITTAALGVPIGKTIWVETLWHNYRQSQADNRISGSRLDVNPDGKSRKLGDEFDAILSYRPSPAWELELTTGAFKAGPAFGAREGNWAGLVEVKLDRNF